MFLLFFFFNRSSVAHRASSIEYRPRLNNQRLRLHITLYLTARTKRQLLVTLDLTFQQTHDLCVLAYDRAFHATGLTDHHFTRTLQVALNQSVDTKITVGCDVTYDLTSCGQRIEHQTALLFLICHNSILFLVNLHKKRAKIQKLFHIRKRVRILFRKKCIFS